MEYTAGRYRVLGDGHGNQPDNQHIKIEEYHANGSGMISASLNLDRDDALDLHYLISRALGERK